MNLNENQITEIKGLENLSNLVELYLENNQISELGRIDSLNRLKDLWLSNNRIKKLDDLKFLSTLNTADLSDNQISYVNWKSLNEDIYTITKKIWLVRNPIWRTL